MAAICSALLVDGVDPSEVDALAAQLQHAGQPKAAEQIVEDWEAWPALLSDRDFTFAQGTDQARTVRLKILGGDYYWSLLLPNVNEWAKALYGDNAVQLLQDAQANPIGFMLEMFQRLVDRPHNDRLKVSFYQFAAATFSTPDQVIAPEFFAICPPDEQMGSIMKLVETNRANFMRWWAGLPGLLALQLSSLYLTAIQAIQLLNESVTSYMLRTAQGIKSTLLSNGGPPDTGAAGSSVSQAESPPPM